MNALFELRGRRGWLVPASAIALVVISSLSGCSRKDSVRIVGFGPTPVEHGKPFNVQPDGSSAIWVRADKPVDARDVLVLDGHPLPTVITGDLLTAVVPSALTSSPGPKPLSIELDSQRQGPAVSLVVK